MAEWFEDYFDERYVAFYPVLQSESLAEEDCDFLERAMDLKPGARVLDLGCGQGRHAVALAKRGYRVTGLDVSSYMMERARGIAEREGVSVDWVEGRMEGLDGLGPFDAVYSVYVAFGYYGDSGDMAVLEAVRSVLVPGGRLVLGLANAAGALAQFPKTTWWETDQAVLRERDDYDALSGWVSMERTIFWKKGGVEVLPRARIRVYLPYEAERLLEAAGFEGEMLFGGYDGSPFQWRRSEHQIHVARAV